MELLSLSTARNILKEGSQDRMRMRMYADALNGLHVIILTKRSQGFKGEVVHDGPLHLYPTHSYTRVGMIVRTFFLGVQILRRNRMSITSQDPLELGFLAYLLSRLFAVSFNVQVHGDYWSKEWMKGSVFKGMRRILLKFVMRHASSIRVVSERIKRSLLDHGVTNSKIRLLPIRPELERFLEATRARTRGEEFVILTVSRLAQEKNIPTIITAFKEVVKTCNKVILRIVGSGPEEPRLRKLVERYDLTRYVSFAPWTESVPQEMVNADVFILASRHEAYGLVLVEALASGIPVITADVGCVGEVVLDHVHGIVVYNATPHAYAEAMLRMYNDKEFRKQASEAGRSLGRSLSAVTKEMYREEWAAAHLNC